MALTRKEDSHKGQFPLTWDFSLFKPIIPPSDLSIASVSLSLDFCCLKMPVKKYENISKADNNKLPGLSCDLLLVVVNYLDIQSLMALLISCKSMEELINMDEMRTRLFSAKLAGENKKYLNLIQSSYLDELPFRIF